MLELPGNASQPSRDTTSFGSQSSSIRAIRAGGSVVDSGTKAAPSHKHPRATVTKAAEFGNQSATRSSGSTPSAESPEAIAHTRSRSSEYVNDS